MWETGEDDEAEKTTSLAHMDSASSGASILPRWRLCQRQAHRARPGLAVSLHALDHLQQLADSSLDELDRRNLFGVLWVLNNLVLFLWAGSPLERDLFLLQALQATGTYMTRMRLTVFQVHACHPPFLRDPW